MMKTCDVILIWAGSIGVPVAMSLGALGVKTVVIDKMPSPGQGGGENKHASAASVLPIQILEK